MFYILNLLTRTKQNRMIHDSRMTKIAESRKCHFDILLSPPDYNVFIRDNPST